MTQDHLIQDHLSPRASRGAKLSIFFGTEMWERYGFYIVQSLLALYLSLQLHLSDSYIYTLVGSFTALTYISPIIGGWIADYFIGQKKAVLLGGVLLLGSYILLAFALSLPDLLLAFASIAMGTGLLKPSISSLLGRQYELSDPRRDSAFTIFYLGITCGIILGTTLPYKLQEWFGWQACFFSAAIGMVLALFIFSLGIKVLNIQEYAVLKFSRVISWLSALGIIIFSYCIFYLLLSIPYLAHVFFIFIMFFALGLVLKIAIKEQGDQRKKTLCLFFLFIISGLFWAFYFEMFMLLTLFITRTVQPEIFNINFPAPYYVAVESIGMLIFGLGLSKLWLKLGQKNNPNYQKNNKKFNPAVSISLKFFFSIIFIFAAYCVILLCAHSASQNLISPWPILLAYLLISVAELLLSPIGLAAVTRLARPKVVSTLMGVFFVSLGVGGFLSGQLAKLAVIHRDLKNLSEIKQVYFQGFLHMVALLLGLIILAGIASLLIRALSKNIDWNV